MRSADLEGWLEGRQRVVIEAVAPELDGGRFPIQRTVGEEVVVEADIFCDGHDLLSAVLKYKKETDPAWSERWMEPLRNDRWRGIFLAREIGVYRYTIEAWVDHFKSWRRDLEKKIRAGQSVEIELQMGASWIERVAGAAREQGAEQLRRWACFPEAISKRTTC